MQVFRATSISRGALFQLYVYCSDWSILTHLNNLEILVRFVVLRLPVQLFLETLIEFYLNLCAEICALDQRFVLLVLCSFFMFFLLQGSRTTCVIFLHFQPCYLRRNVRVVTEVSFITARHNFFISSEGNDFSINPKASALSDKFTLLPFSKHEPQ